MEEKAEQKETAPKLVAVKWLIIRLVCGRKLMSKNSQSTNCEVLTLVGQTEYP